MKIALVRSPSTYADWYHFPHFSLSCLGAVLDANGFEYEIFDAYYHGWSMDTLLGKVIEYAPTVVGLTAMTHEIVRVHHIASEIKKRREVVCIVGGCHVTALPERTLMEFPSFDYGVLGEGERPLLNLMQNLKALHPSSVHEIHGLVFRDHHQIRLTEKGTPLTSDELNELPFPAYHKYLGNDKRALAGKNAEYCLMGTRGCPYRCSFCMQVLGRQVRRRSPENIVREIETAINRYGAHTFRFEDELLVTNNRYARTLLELMISSGASKKIRWSAHTRANGITSDIVALAKKAGCFLLSMGVESGDDDVLRRIQKGITVDQVRKAAKTIKKHGITLGTYFIIGHPHESHVTAQRTVDLAAELNSDTIAVGIMVPYPGTRIFEMAGKGEGGYRIISEDWSQYDKYGNQALELELLSSRDLQRYQLKAYLTYFLKNFRFLALAQFLWSKRRGIYFLLRKRLSQSKPLSRRQTG